jgi:DNA invertase Pin-like site-specific DNA recombinase
MGAFAEFERALMRERQRAGIVLAKQRGYPGRKRSLTPDGLADARRRVDALDKRAQIAAISGLAEKLCTNSLAPRCDLPESKLSN